MATCRRQADGSLLGDCSRAIARCIDPCRLVRRVAHGQPQGDTLLVNLVGTGNATQLGRFTLTAQFTITLTGASSGTATWTAANGDRIFTTVTGQGTRTAGTATLVETHTITGGTGRFAGASGTIIVHRSLDLGTLSSSASITGSLNLGHYILAMAVRRVAAGVLEAVKGFRRLKGHKEMPKLVAALRARDQQLGPVKQDVEKIA